MAKKKTDVVALQEELARAIKDNKELQGHWMEATQQAGKCLAYSSENAQLKKRLLVIDHITAGRVNEAIQEIITPLPMLFTLDVRFADDKTRIAAEDETLAAVVKHVTEKLQEIKFKRPEKDAGK